jgi:Putative Actinobacterial Holin-X, holin superfamily III
MGSGGDAPGPDPAAMSTGQLVSSIKEDLSSLVRGEIELAKAELRESAVRAGAGGALVGAAGYLAVLASVLLSVAAAYGLTGLGLHPGWAFLIVGGAYLLVVAALLLVARSRFRGIQGPVRAKRIAAAAGQALRPGSRP